MFKKYFPDLIKLEKWLFFLLIFFLPFQTRIILKQWGEPFNEWNSFSFYLTDLFLLAIIFLWLVRIYKKQTVFKIGKIGMTLFVFWAIAAASLFKTQNFWLGVFWEIKLIEMGILFLYVKNCLFVNNNAPSSPFNIRGGEGGVIIRIFQIFVASGVLQAIIAIGQFICQKSFGLSFLDESPLSPSLAGVAKIVVDGAKMIRPYGLTPHPNILAALLLIAIFCVLVLFTQKNKEFKWRAAILYSLVVAILTFAFFITFSRAVIGIGLSAIFVWLIYNFFKSGRKWFYLNTIAIFGICCLAMIIIFWPYLSARFDVESALTDQSFNLRVFYNQAAFDFIKHNSFFGVGIGNFVSAFQKAQPQTAAWIYQPVHNIYLLIAAEIGILGLTAFLTFLFLTIKSVWKYRSNLERNFLLYAVCAFLLIGLFDHFFWTLQQGQLMLWLILGIMAGKAGPCSSTDRAQPSEG